MQTQDGEMTHMYVYNIYIYIQRESEREREILNISISISYISLFKCRKTYICFKTCLLGSLHDITNAKEGADSPGDGYMCLWPWMQ